MNSNIVANLRRILPLAVMTMPLTLLILSACGGGGGGAGGGVSAPAVIAPAFYVNAATGLDTNAGTLAAPYKTITYAIKMSSAVAAAGIANIYVASGVYSAAANGEVFPLMPTTGENLIGSGVADIEGAGNYTVAGGQLSGEIFSTTFVFASGVTGSMSGMSASGVAPTFVVADNANVTLKNNSLLFPVTDNTKYAVWIVDGSTATISGNAISAWVAIDTADAATKVVARGNSLTGTYAICTADLTATASQLDLGTAASPGNNSILNGNVAYVPSSAANNWGTAGDAGVNAAGNTWLPNVQGADSLGHYAAQSIAGPTTGSNYDVAPAAGIKF